ncbi:DNA-binding MurR/RpiR family transcriptional regulator [Rhodoferax ferrireducens]|uniref:DNA-binding MurR/RpiR family transcriptional regulator n=1 Tax=Rhodoferax ferrireducens TaxID=192843 RepID=A0ABU2C421_9BURK|nr:MurR/RpiR family transcriptional regulator [Rhodoferax ferrireducens]MDR7375992.1 DNA-binding MurR/RpiR family transcriptional regulator [Rhodoferax ferrireducens]
MPATESFVRRVRTQLDGLSTAERRLADFVLAFPGELASYAASELARLAGVSNATVTRLIQRLGYASYEDARRHAREERQSGSPLFQASTGKEKSARLVATHLQQSQLNLARTFEQLPDETVKQMVAALLAAPQVLVFGSRSSHAFAVYLRWQIIQVLPRVTAIPGAGESLGEYLADLSARDCVVVFGVRRQTRQMRQLLDGASQAGAKIIFISDQSSPDYPAATWSIQCKCAGPGPLDNHVAVMALCDMLATLVIEGAGPAGRKRLAAIELAHEALDEL